MRASEDRIRVHVVPRDEAGMPPPAVFARYMQAIDALQSEGAAATVDSEALEAVFRSRTLATRAAFHWAKHHLAVRLRHGDYALVDPSVAVRTWAIPGYYAALLTTSTVLAARRIPHAFACLTAMRGADYVPDAPILVTPHRVEERTDKVEAVRYDFATSHVGSVQLEVLGANYDVPVLDGPEAAVVFAGMGLPRTRRVARELARGHAAREDLAFKLNFYGIRLDKRVFTSLDPHVKLPHEWEERRRRYADSAALEAEKADG